MTSLSKKFERLKEIPSEHGINPSLPLPEQDPSLPQAERGRQLNWNPRFASLVLSVIAVFLKKVSDIDKVETESFLGYMVMAGNVKTL
ncbi:hypothetical protein Tco_1322578, partial [Tanacetum coccineum]